MLNRAVVVLGFIASSVWMWIAGSEMLTPFVIGGIWAITGQQIIHHLRREVMEERDDEEYFRSFGSKINDWSRLQRVFRRRG